MNPTRLRRIITDPLRGIRPERAEQIQAIANMLSHPDEVEAEQPGFMEQLDAYLSTQHIATTIRAICLASQGRRKLQETMNRLWPEGHPFRQHMVARWFANEPRTFLPTCYRDWIKKRDKYQCVACGSKAQLCIDHIWPHKLLGHDAPDNLQTLCSTCNTAKGAFLPDVKHYDRYNWYQANPDHHQQGGQGSGGLTA